MRFNFSKSFPLGRLYRACGRIWRWFLTPTARYTYYPDCAHKSKARILWELVCWKVRYGEFNRYYYLYGLDRQGMSPRSMMGSTDFWNYRNARNLKPETASAYYASSYNYVCILRDKLLFHQFASSFGLPVPKVQALSSSGKITWLDSGRTESWETAALTREIDAVCKPVDGLCGMDIFHLKISAGRIYINQREVAAGKISKRLTGRFIIQNRIEQHPHLAEFHAASVNTLRLVTFFHDDSAKLAWSTLRIGTSGRPNDNWATGGILVKILRATGTLDACGFLKPAYGNKVKRHPDSGLCFEGRAVPHFTEAVALVKRFHSCLPGIHSIGWDVAITPEGPVIIEGNDDWDGDVAMTIDPDFRRHFMAHYTGSDAHYQDLAVAQEPLPS